MNQTTESQPTTPAKSTTLQTAIIWCVIIGGGILIPSPFFRAYHAPEGFFLSPFPWVIVGGMTIEHGLQMFTGKIPPLPGLAAQFGCLLSLLVTFVIAPTLFLFGVRARAAERASGIEGRILRKSTYLLVLGGLVVMVPAMVSVPIALIQRSVSSSLHKAQAEQENKDAIMYELNSVAWKLYEYRSLPKELGGGNGSLNGFILPKELATTTEAEYKVEPHDTLAIAKATSVRYPLGTITATISSKGKFLEWKYSEFFQ